MRSWSTHDEPGTAAFTAMRCDLHVHSARSGAVDVPPFTRVANESYAEPLFLGHLLGGIRYALAAKDVTTPAPTVLPSIRDVTFTVRNRRVSVRLRVVDCSPCKAIVVVRSKTVLEQLVATDVVGWKVRVYAIEIDEARNVERVVRVP